MSRKGKGERPGKNYLEHHHESVNVAIPKGLLGYTGKAPNFSTKILAELWILQLMQGFASEPSREKWYGKALIQEIRRRTRIPGVFPGYEPSEGVVFGLLSKFTNDGLIEEAGEGEPTNFGNAPKLYRITPAGAGYLQELKKQHQHNVMAGAMIFNRLHVDLFGQDLLDSPTTIDQVRYVEQAGDSNPDSDRRR